MLRRSQERSSDAERHGRVPPHVRWGTHGDRWTAAWIARFPIALGVLAICLVPVVVFGAIALAGTADAPPPWWRVALAVLFFLAILAVPVYFGYRSLRAWRATYWLMVDVFGVHLISGRSSSPILTIRADQLDSAELLPDPYGATVLLIETKPRLDDATLTEEVSFVGRTVVVGTGLTRSWDLGFALDGRCGDPRLLFGAVDRLRVAPPPTKTN